LVLPKLKTRELELATLNKEVANLGLELPKLKTKQYCCKRYFNMPQLLIHKREKDKLLIHLKYMKLT